MSTTIKPTPPQLIQDLGTMYPKDTSIQKRRYGLYKCNCGNEFKAQTACIKSGRTLSCGCHKINMFTKLITTHSMSRHRLHNIWVNMIHRCNNDKCKEYHYYGGRGIKVCERWLDIRNFIEDMYPSYKEGLTIDRIKNDGNYELSNCRWATKNTQSRNTRLICLANESGYRGVSFHNASKKWRACITLSGKQKHIGLYDTALESAKAYDTYVIENNLEHTINGVL